MEEISLEDKTKWSLTQKITHSLELIDSFYNTLEGKVYIGFSGGKDSVVLKWLCDKFTDTAGLPRIQCVFNNTTNELTEMLKFVRTFGDEVLWLRPKMTFAQSLEVNGFPLISKAQAQYIKEAKTTKSDKLRNLRINGREVIKDGVSKVIPHISKKWKYLVEEDIKITDKCCTILKKNPVKEYEKETGLSPIIGVKAKDSSLRYITALKNNTCNTYGNRNVSKPLNIFTDEDIWEIIKKYNIPYCNVYDDKVDSQSGEIIKGLRQTGCAYCAFGAHMETKEESRFKRLYQTDKNRYFSMMDKLGYRDALHLIGIELPDDKK